MLCAMQTYKIFLTLSDPVIQPVRNGPTAAPIDTLVKAVGTISNKKRLPIDPVPSIMAATVALAFSLPSSDL